MKVIWTIGALQSLRAIRHYIAADHQAAAVRVADRIEQVIRRLETFPESGRTGVRAGTREIVITSTPFVVVYRIHSDEVQVLRVFHSKQQRH